jgi:hypothetical protein
MSAHPDRKLTARELANLPREEQRRILREEAERIERAACEREELEHRETASQKRKAPQKKTALPNSEEASERDELTQRVLAGLPPSRQNKVLQQLAGKRRIRRGKRQANPPVESCKALLKSLIEQGITKSKEVERSCCKVHHFSRDAFFAARRALKLRAVRRGGLGKDGYWELVPE